MHLRINVLKMHIEPLALKDKKRSIPLIKTGLGNKSKDKSRKRKLDSQKGISCGEPYLDYFVQVKV
jgi:hypothetical protein